MKELLTYIKFVDNHALAIIGIIIFFSIIEIVLRFSKSRIGAEYEIKRDQVERFGDIEKDTIVFYRRNQTLDVVRVISALFGITIALVVFDIKALNILAIATGALIIILKDQILSFLGYFYVISVYDIGDDLRIGGVLGEVVRFKPFFTALAGKDDSGEYNGRLLYIPNHKCHLERSQRSIALFRFIELNQ